jgi:decaprenyl-phosphate phosphoribosyltransferase
MGVKRYSEFRFLGDKTIAGQYRRSFCFYTEESLLISSFFYALCSTFYLGVFLIKYRIELLFSLPFVAFLFTWYLHIGMKPDSAAQHPEHLYAERGFVIYVFFVVTVMTVLMFFDIPILKWLLKNAFITQ